MHRVYLDCGYYAGNALKLYSGLVDEDWIIHAFEPNPDIELNILPGVNLIKKAVWTEKGEINFHIAGREDAAGIADLTGHTAPKEVTVPTIDFSDFVSRLPEAYIICSMDIEGAEYKVLERMIEDKTISRINILDIEFHHRLMNDYDKDYTQELINELTHKGVKVILKVPLE